MKTKRSMKQRTCSLCKETIQKGQQYGQKSITVGYSGTWGHGNDCKCCGGVMPAWAYSTPVRVRESVCVSCANPEN